MVPPMFFFVLRRNSRPLHEAPMQASQGITQAMQLINNASTSSNPDLALLSRPDRTSSSLSSFSLSPFSLTSFHLYAEPTPPTQINRYLLNVVKQQTTIKQIHPIIPKNHPSPVLVLPGTGTFIPNNPLIKFNGTSIVAKIVILLNILFV